MNLLLHSSTGRLRALPALLAALSFAVTPSSGADSDHITVPTEGGMPAIPLITGVHVETNQVTVSWQSACPPYRLWQKQSVDDPTWQLVAGPIQSNSVRITLLSSNAFFRVSGPSPQYAGARACEECHSGIHASEMDTRHAAALETLKQIGQGNNQSCLPCHTVGFGLPTGFINESKSAHLAGVQCENCHGPAALHAANESDPLFRPRVELAGQLCGGCHTGSHHPTYDEWSGTGHAHVVEDMNPSGRINSCGRCHSGSARMALLKNDPLPEGDANIGITCVTCHDPHQQTANPHQLRNPTASTNDYFLATSDVFTNKYNPDINVCAQCHNHRGASWTSSGRPPHHSPQYNMLLGTVGVLPDGTSPYVAGHASVEKQCVGCHMQSEEFVSEAEPAVTGHGFKVDTYGACGDCHSLPELLVEFTAGAVSSQIQQVKASLDWWGANKAPEPLRSKYGALAWEYSTPGSLSEGSGPTSSEQALIPDNIKKARFNVYVVLYDGSYGSHNGPYTITLLQSALDWVQQEINK